MRTHHLPPALTVVVGALVAASAGAARAQSVRGTLLEERTDRPIPAASIALLTEQGTETGPGATTDSGGRFVLRAPGAGVYRLRATSPGYRATLFPAIELRAAEEIGLTLHLSADTTKLGRVVVTAKPTRVSGRLGGFYERMAHAAFGRFVSREQIEQRRPIRVSDLLQTVSGLQLLPSRRGLGMDLRTAEGCRPLVYLDGLRFPLRGETIDDLVLPMDLEGVEIYTHAIEVPVEYQGAGSACGAILLWTHAPS